MFSFSSAPIVNCFGFSSVLKYGHKIVKLQPSPSAKLFTASKSFQIPDLNRQEREVVDKLFNGLCTSNRACLAQSITLIESTHARKKLQARELLQKALHYCKTNQTEENVSFRIGRISRIGLLENLTN